MADDFNHDRWQVIGVDAMPRGRAGCVVRFRKMNRPNVVIEIGGAAGSFELYRRHSWAEIEAVIERSSHA